MRHTTPVPGERAPALQVEVLGGRPIDLVAERPEHFSVIFFYRGIHCPICRKQLEELNGKLGEFRELGVNVHAVSMDDEERAKRQKAEWAISELSIGHGLTESSAREWGLFISAKEKDAEPTRFAEPGIAVLAPDTTIAALYLQSVPFARPTLDGLKQGLKFVIENEYPVRGKVAA